MGKALTICLRSLIWVSLCYLAALYWAAYRPPYFLLDRSNGGVREVFLNLGYGLGAVLMSVGLVAERKGRWMPFFGFLCGAATWLAIMFQSGVILRGR